jgi:hypothetical protein
MVLPGYKILIRKICKVCSFFIFHFSLFIFPFSLISCYSLSAGLTWSEEQKLHNLGLMTPHEADIVAADLVSNFIGKQIYDDWIMEHEHAPMILLGAISNNSTEWIDTGIVADGLRRAITVSGKAELAEGGGQNILIPAEEHGRFLSSAEQESLRAIQRSRADMVLTGKVDTGIFKKNLSPIRNYYVMIELRDARDLNRIVWKGKNSTLNKAVKGGPVRKAFYRRGRRGW